MIIKAISAKGFGGVLDYIEKEDSKKLFSNAVRVTPKEIYADMEMYRSTKPNIKNPCLHFIVSFDKEDKNIINSEAMENIGKKILELFGATDENQYVAIQHFDGGTPHFHICLNRINLSGNVLNDSYSKRRLDKIRKDLEDEYSELKKAQKKNIGFTKQENLRGADKVKYKIYTAINVDIANCKTILDLIEKLEKNHNVKSELKFKIGSKSEYDGIKFYHENVWLKGSAVDKDCSYFKLIERINPTQKQEQTETDKIKALIHKSILSELKTCKDISELITKLKVNHNIDTDIKYRSGSDTHVDGIKFGKDNIWFKGSEIDRQCSYGNLIKQLNCSKENSTNTETINEQKNPIKELRKIDDDLESINDINNSKNVEFNILYKIPQSLIETAIQNFEDLLIANDELGDTTILNKGNDFIQNRRRKMRR